MDFANRLEGSYKDCGPKPTVRPQRAKAQAPCAVDCWMSG